MDASIKALHGNFLEWMAGPTGAVLLHLGLLLALIFLVDFRGNEPVREIEVQLIEVEERQLDDLLDQIIPEDVLPEMEETLTPPEVDLEMEMPDVEDFAASPEMEPMAELEIASDAISPIILKNLAPGSMANRTDSGRAASIRRYGGEWGQYAEVAVQRALEWLRINQNMDGSWGTHDKEAMAALGILTFLAHGETVASETYGETVKNAIQYLVVRQNEKGEYLRIAYDGQKPRAQGAYAQAVCNYAISEAYGMTRIPSLKTAMEKGLQVLIDGQQAAGGFDYEFQKVGRRDTSLAGWCGLGMKAAYLAGSENPRLPEAMEGIVRDLKSAQKEDGSFWYSHSGTSHSTHSIAAVAVLVMQLLGHGGDAEVEKGLEFLEGAECRWKKPPQWPMYAWYHISQAKFHQGGAQWKAWNAACAPALIRNQNPDGSWASPGVAAFPPGSEGREDMHPVYATTLAALTLQVYYRFLPTYQPIQTRAVDQTSDDDVQIQIR